jgi:hypothetical protein
MGQKLPLCGQLGAARSRQDESKEVGELGSKRTSSGCNGVHHVRWGGLIFRLSQACPPELGAAGGERQFLGAITAALGGSGGSNSIPCAQVITPGAWGMWGGWAQGTPKQIGKSPQAIVAVHAATYAAA